ncbi:MAG: hypothetical protein M3Q74_02315, partial [Pseudomonadota bacterium]|nr:hypothetical protein [Pseudomonadota bacterium]
MLPVIQLNSPMGVAPGGPTVSGAGVRISFHDVESKGNRAALIRHDPGDRGRHPWYRREMTTPLGPNWLAAFQGSEYSLRFELGGETLSNLTQPVPRFLQAFDRARAIADAVFPGVGALLGVVGFWKLGELELFHPEAKPG